MRRQASLMIRALVASAVVIGAGRTAGAQQAAQPSPWDSPVGPNERMVALVAQDFSDCTNTTVQNDPNRTRGGEIWVTRQSDGSTSIRVAMTATPNTTYHFYLKCVRELGTIKTDEEGTGMATFSFPTGSVGSTFAFDSYPSGAPAGNKFQSVTVRFQ